MATTAQSTPTIYAARPTLRFSGQEDLRASELLLALHMDECEGGMSALEMRLSNIASLERGSADIAFGSNSRLQLGAAIEVYLGDEARPREIFRGHVTALEWRFDPQSPPEIVVLAEDALQAARMARRSKTYTNMSPADVVRSVASGLGLQPVISGLSGPTGTWAQLNESDLAFLRRLLARFDADLQIVGADLHVSPRGNVRRGALTLDLADQLVSARVVADLSEQVSQVTVRGWNAVDGAAVDATIVNGAHIGPGRGQSGALVLRQTLGERSEHLAHVVVATRDEAEAVAQAAFDLRARRLLRVEGKAVGDAQLRVGMHLTLAGMDDRIDNTYYVVRTRHVYDRVRGYFTEFGAECAYLAN